MDYKEMILPLAAAAVSGAATTVVAPKVAGYIADPKNPKNWYAPAAVGVALGAGLLAAGMMRREGDAIAHVLAVGGAAMAGTAAGLGYMAYNSRKAVAGNLAAGNLSNIVGAPYPGLGVNTAAKFSGLTPTQRAYAQRGGMPVGSHGR